jgi:hypothetical protein
LGARKMCSGSRCKRNMHFTYWATRDAELRRLFPHMQIGGAGHSGGLVGGGVATERPALPGRTAGRLSEASSAESGRRDRASSRRGAGGASAARSGTTCPSSTSSPEMVGKAEASHRVSDGGAARRGASRGRRPACLVMAPAAAGAHLPKGVRAAVPVPRSSGHTACPAPSSEFAACPAQQRPARSSPPAQRSSAQCPAPSKKVTGGSDLFCFGCWRLDVLGGRRCCCA